MKVLIACEESQIVCKAFREKGHEAYSCDLLECSGGHPEWHIKGDVLQVLNPFAVSDLSYGVHFTTMDGTHHFINGRWDLIIAHPPCTRLCITGQRWLYFGDEKYRSDKISEQQKAIVFFMYFVFADCDKIVIENPVGIMSSAFRKPDCIYNPYDFEGETECKRTCLWVKGVDPLIPSRVIPLPKNERTHGIFKSCFNGRSVSWNSSECSNFRSKTPYGVAKAMADQWG